MSFFHQFARTFNDISTATFVTLRTSATKQANEKKVEYGKLLNDPEFLTIDEIEEVFDMDANTARATLAELKKQAEKIAKASEESK